MSETEVHAALMARIEALATSLPIEYPGRAFTPPAGGDWLRVTHMPNTPDRPGLSASASLRRMGFLQIDLFAQLDRHEIEYIEAARPIADHFNRDRRLTNGNSRVVIVNSYVGRGRKDDRASLWMVPVVVEYRVEEV